MPLTTRAVEVYRENGIWTLIFRTIKYGYNTLIRPHLPKNDEFVMRNEVKISRRHWFDSIVPFDTFPSDDPNHEDAYIEMVRKHIVSGQTVVVIGGGWGVSTVAAANQVGNRGKVVCYEGSKKMYETTRRTVEYNGVDGWTNVEHAIVSDYVRLAGGSEAEEAPNIRPSEIPPSDVIMIDCDGCEIDLLSHIGQPSELIILEHHAVYDGRDIINYQPVEIKGRLEKNGYEILETNVARIGRNYPQFGDEETVFVASIIE